MKKIIVLFILSVLIFSCKKSEAVPFGYNFYFEAPQPINDSELSAFPNKFKGIYINSDSTCLNITDNVIFYESETKFRFHKKQIDSLKQYFDIVDGKYISKNTNEIFRFCKVGDSVEFKSKNIDTIFKFSDSQKAKRINGCLVLSERDSIYWRVKLICLNKKTITIKQLFSEDDLKRIDSITKIHSKLIDSTSFIITPMRIEFARFFKLKKLGFDQIYIKINK
ncbi:MAG: hypothetical protein RIQ59_921 [Bacteroidota bacterium]|jgi:hypothetical protein